MTERASGVVFGFYGILIATLSRSSVYAVSGSEPLIVATQVIAADVSLLGATSFQAGDGTHVRQSVDEGSLSFLRRRQIREGPWYWGWGVLGDIYSFDNQGQYPIRHLQDYAAQATLEYFIDAKPVAYLTVHPGFYFEDRATFSSWDIPFELVSGIPITQSLSGVVGLDEARFYRVPTPIAGVSWAVNAKVRLDLIYPDPACVIAVKKNLEARIAGELIGGGFRTPESPGQSHVDYFEYRLGGHLALEIKRGVKVMGGAGYVVNRVSNYLPDSRRDHMGGAPFVHAGLELSN